MEMDDSVRSEESLEGRVDVMGVEAVDEEEMRVTLCYQDTYLV
jgi:hypothetical protein